MLPSTSSSGSGLSAPRSSSSLSTHRPASSASNRPISRLSARPHSRHARTRILPFCQRLVTQVAGLQEGSGDGGGYHAAVEYAVKHLESTTVTKAAANVNMDVVDRQIRGHVEKARINCQDDLAEALKTCYGDLKGRLDALTDLDNDIQRYHVPDHVRFLLTLSAPPSPSTLVHASTYLFDRAHPPAPPEPLTWAKILAEEPFEGEHWEGVYGLPAGYVKRPRTEEKGFYDKEKEKERLDWDSRWSTPSLSPLNSADLELDQTDDELYDDENLSFPELSGKLDENQGLDHTSATRVRPPQRDVRFQYAHRQELEALQAKQYWRPEWRNDDSAMKALFSLGDASTLGPTLRSVLRPTNDHMRSPISPPDVLLYAGRYINEEDAVREVLIALQGRNNIMLEWETAAPGRGSYTTTRSTPSLLHLSLASQASILSSLASFATPVCHLRQFVDAVFKQSWKLELVEQNPGPKAASGRRIGPTRTLEAFADAIDAEIRLLDSWCATKEEAICKAWGGVCDGASGDDLVVSLLNIEKELRDSFEQSFAVLLAIAQGVYPSISEGDIATTVRRGLSASAGSAMLLDRLFESMQEHLERRERVTSEVLMRVFVRSAEPIWDMVGRWLKDGMGLGVGIGGSGTGTGELDDEFFIESTGLGLGMMGMGLLDPDFWKDGYILREGAVLGDIESSKTPGEGMKLTIPLFLENVAEQILRAGKAVGLLRALGVLSSSSTRTESLDKLAKWQSFERLVGLSPPSPITPSHLSSRDTGSKGGMLFFVSIDSLSRLIYDALLPHCNAAGALLAEVLIDDCAVLRHLTSIEGLFLMRKGDAMSHFTDVLFAKMDSSPSWTDFHLLNTALRDVIQANFRAGTKQWIQPSLVRLSYRKGRERVGARPTIKAIDALTLEYAVPFPLTYIFQPATIRVYGDIFVLLVQIRRAKGLLERILVRGEGRGAGLRQEVKAFYAMRSRLSWFINTLSNFLTTYVIHTQVVKFHEAFEAAKSLDEMIDLHNAHLDKIQGRCLLKSNTSSLHRAIVSILEMTVHFSDLFFSFAGNTAATHDVSQHSISLNRHRSRRMRRQRQNVIGFSQSVQETFDSSDEEEDAADLDETRYGAEPSFSADASTSYVEDGAHIRLDKMSKELDGLVRFLRRGVETLAGGTGDAASAFGILAFALEDWDS